MPLFRSYVKGSGKKVRKERYFHMQPAFLGFAVLCAVFIEIAGFIVVGSRIGVLATLALVMIAMFAGVQLLRSQGLSILKPIQDEISAGRTPDREMAEGAMIVTGAILLIVPGFVSDVIGILLFIKPVRLLLWRHMAKHLNRDRAQRKGARQETKTIDLDDHEYHSTDPENSPWRTPDGSGRN